MARLPSALKQKEELVEQQMRLRRENLQRVARRTAPQPLPEPAVRLPPDRASGAGQADEAAGQPELTRLRDRTATLDGMLRKAGEETATERAARIAAEEQARRDREAAVAARRQAEGAQAELEALRRRQGPGADDLRRYGITEEMLAEFGESQCRVLVETARNAAGEISRGAMQSVVGQLQQRLEQAEGRLERERAALARDRETERNRAGRQRQAQFVAALDHSIPHWREINASAGFLHWLDQRDPLRGVIRQEMLAEAEAAGDAARVLSFFNAYQQSQARPDGRNPQRRVLPNGRPPAELHSERPAEPLVSRAEVREHERRISRDRRYRDSEESRHNQARFDKAARDGRIR